LRKLAVILIPFFERSLNRDYAREMNFTGKVMKGMIYVSPEGIKSDYQPQQWIAITHESDS